MMKYFKSKIGAMRREYRGREKERIIATVGSKCQICGRKNGDIFLFGPTKYIKKQIRFKVKVDIHVIDGGDREAPFYLVICDGCHLSYHLFNRLREDAEFGGKKLADTLYKRCTKCGELNCLCCSTCGKHSKWCTCMKPIRKIRGKRKVGRPKKLSVRVRCKRVRRDQTNKLRVK
jgi:hypothetical protein